MAAPWRKIARAGRALARSPRYTLAVVVTLALAVGANTAAFSFVRGVLLRSLPMADPGRVVLVGHRAGDGRPTDATSPAMLELLDREATTLEAVAGFAYWDGRIQDGDDAARVLGGLVGPGYFAILGQPPALGREFIPEDAQSGSAPVVIISDRLWRTQLGADPDVIGRTVRVNDRPRRVIGVLRPHLVSPDMVAFSREAGDVFLPLPSAAARGFGYRVVRGVARTAPGVAVAAVDREMATLAAGVAAEHPEVEAPAVAAMPVREYFVHDQRRILLLMQLAVLVVLLIAAVNVMNLTLARGIERSRALAVHAAMGAGRSQLVRLVLGEVLLAATAGGLLGALLAAYAVPVVLAPAPGDIPQLAWVRVDGLTLAGAAGFTLAAALLAGLVPGLRLTAHAVPSVARGGLRTTRGRGHRRLQRTLVATQIALAAALLVGAGLLARSFHALTAVDLGYTTEGVRMVQVDLPRVRYPDGAARLAFLDRLGGRLAARPEVAAVAFGTTAPQHGLNNFATGIEVVGRMAEVDDPPYGFIRSVTPGYLDALDLPVVEGRPLEAGDVAPGSVRAALVSRAFQRRFLPGGALGQRLVAFGDTVRVVGVTAGMRYAWPGEAPEPEVFLPYDGRFSTVVLVARAAGDDRPLARAIREEVRRADRNVPVDRVPSLRELLDRTVAGPRFLATLVAILAAIALGISAVGIYSVLSFMVARRRQEIGIRMALGARVATVRRMLLAEGARLALLGLAAGLGLAWLGGRLLDGLLFGVGARDPMVFAFVPVALALVALAASWLPARRATRVDPAMSIREDS